MPSLPHTSAVPQSNLAAPPPSSSAVPSGGHGSQPAHDQAQEAQSDEGSIRSQRSFTIPKLRLEIRDLSHAGASRALSALDLSACTSACARSVLGLLYASPDCPTTTVPPTRSITFILRDMPGVAYTTGSDLDNDHKEIHFSLGYIANIKPAERVADEIAGVVTHEVVHCLQYNGFGACPGGLIEGIADWVRLRAGYVPPHWKRETKGSWDAGYQQTGYFLEYLETRFGHGTIRRLNEKLRIQKYEKDMFWLELFGQHVDELWEAYCKHVSEDAAED